jgi:hypothetical protein
MKDSKIWKVSDFWNALLSTNAEIEPYGDMQGVILQEVFVEGVLPSYRKDLKIKYHEKLFEMKKEGKSVVEDAWLLGMAEALEEATPKYTPKPEYTPRVNALTTSDGVPAFALVDPLSSEGRQWLMVHGRCFTCRKYGHMRQECPEGAQDHEKKQVRSSAPNPPRSAVTGGGVKWGRSRNVIPKRSRLPASQTYENLSVGKVVTEDKDSTVKWEIEDVSEDEPRGYVNESPADGSLIERVSESLADDSLIQREGELSTLSEELDISPMMKYSAPRDRKLFQCYVGADINDSEPAILLQDSGSCVNIMSLKMAKRARVKITACKSRRAKGVDGKVFQVDKECWAYFRCGKLRKRILFAIADIEDDVILGVPFLKIITVEYQEWDKKQIMVFRTKDGRRHSWYGKGYADESRRANMPIIAMCSIDSIDWENDEVYAINIMDMHDVGDGEAIQTRIDDGITINTMGFESEPTISLVGSSAPELVSKEESQKDFFVGLNDERLEKLLRRYLDTVMSDPPGLDGIPKRKEDMVIELKPGATVKDRPMRRFTNSEDVEVKSKVHELLGKSFVRPSCSPFGANLLFIKKKDGTNRMAVDYRAVNMATVKDRTPLPSHTDMRSQISGSKFLSKVDIRDAFHMIRIRDEDCHKTAFKTKYGLFEFTVCPFGLSNSPATFMRMMNRVFRDLVGECVLFHVDDILIYSETVRRTSNTS